MKINVKHVAKLANLPLSSDETKKFAKQLSDVLQYVEKLQEVHTENVPETNQVTGLENITREDTPAPSLQQGEALSNAKDQHNGLFKVKAILEQ